MDFERTPIGRAIRAEVRPDWDEMHVELVEQRIFAALARRRDRDMWRFVAVAGLAAAAGIAVAVVGRSPTSLARDHAAEVQQAVPMLAFPRPASALHGTPDHHEPASVAPSAVVDDRTDLSAIDAVDEPVRRRHAPRRPRPTTDESADALLARADAARTAGHLAEAADLLATLVRRFPTARSADAACMMRARVLERRGRFAEAAVAYERVLARPSAQLLAEDARAGAALASYRAGDDERAVMHARTYLDAHADGLHAAAMKAIVEPP